MTYTADQIREAAQAHYESRLNQLDMDPVWDFLPEEWRRQETEAMRAALALLEKGS